jgi:MFS transporter, ACS family, D-galactonate transporter
MLTKPIKSVPQLDIKPTNVRWQVFFALLILGTVNYIDRAVLSVAMPEIQRDLNLGPASIGIILSSFFWGYALMQIPSGWIADRYRPDKLVAISAVLWGIFQMFTGFISSSKIFITLRVLLGMSEAPMYPSGAKLQSIWLTSKERGRGASILDCGGPLGSAIGGPLIVVFMAWFGGWRGALIGAGILTIIIAWVVWKVIKGGPDKNPRVNEAERRYIADALAKEYEETRNHTNKTVGAKAYLKNRTFWFMCLGFYSINTIFYGLMTWGPTYLAATQNLNIKVIGGSIFIIFGMGVVGELVGGWIADKWREKGGNYNTVMRTLVTIMGIVSASCMLLLSYTTSATTAVALMSIAVFFLRWSGLFWSMPAALAQREHVGTVGGSMNFIGNIAGIVTPIYIGIIVSATGSYALAIITFAAFGLIIAISGFMLNLNRKVGVES